jgi:Leucine-rich repeat (LRR) protein
LEILDVAVNEIEEIQGLEACSETLDELWMNNNKVSDWSSLEYLGKTMKKLKNLYFACNPLH